MLCRITLGGRAGAIIVRGRAIIEKIAGGGKKVNIYLQVSLLISTFAVIHNYS